MKNLKGSIIAGIVATVCLYSSLAVAGKEGGGGISVVCRDASGTITSAKLLDFAEAEEPVFVEFPNGMSFQNLPNSWQLILDFGLNRISTNGQDYLQYPELYKKVLEEIAKIQGNVRSFKSASVGPAVTYDFHPRISLKNGCRFEQYANFQENGLVMVDAEIGQHLSQLDIAGFYFHEAIYSLARSKKVPVGNSDLVREITANVFNTTFFDQSIKVKLYSELLGSGKPPQFQPNFKVLSLTQTVSAIKLSARISLTSKGDLHPDPACVFGPERFTLQRSVKHDSTRISNRFVGNGEESEPILVQSKDFPDENVNGGEVSTYLWCVNTIGPVILTVIARNLADQVIGSIIFSADDLKVSETSKSDFRHGGHFIRLK